MAADEPNDEIADATVSAESQPDVLVNMLLDLRQHSLPATVAEMSAGKGSATIPTRALERALRVALRFRLRSGKLTSSCSSSHKRAHGLRARCLPPKWPESGHDDRLHAPETNCCGAARARAASTPPDGRHSHSSILRVHYDSVQS